VQLDEPVFALDLTAEERAALLTSYATLAAAVPELKILVAAYFGGLRDNQRCFLSLPVAALHVDLVRAPGELDPILREFDARKLLSLGVVDGRNIWRTDFAAVLPLLAKAVSLFGGERFLIAPSCSLQHVPVTLRNETGLDAECKGWLAYAEEKLAEVVTLRDLAVGLDRSETLSANQSAAESRRTSRRIHRPAVKERVARVGPSDLTRASRFIDRQVLQRQRLHLPLFPTTTIGSFPQTDAVRAARAKWKKNELSGAEYERFLEAETLACVRYQEEIGIDMLVHGEFERSDMVEYFGEQLEGFAFTENAWVQSYGSRYVKPRSSLATWPGPGP
jgi:5-methyltetrahydropteroyltriglutamate--homocysteine methyltransferase